MKVIFLDIDGVLNNDETEEYTPEGYLGIDDILLARLKKIVENTQAKIVLTTSWKDYWDKDETNCKKDGLYINEKFKKFGLKVYDKTIDGGFDRGKGINKYLEDHKEVTNFLIIDDYMFKDFARYDYVKNMIYTDAEDGLSTSDAIEAINILNNNYFKKEIGDAR